MNDEQQSLFIEEVVGLAVLYKDVKDILILAENIDTNQSLYLGPINELRNALDHTMRAFLSYQTDTTKARSEVSKIKEHLLRAGYDGYEIIATTFIQQIQDSPMSEFDTDIVTKIFPDYYNRYKQELVTIKIALKNVRANKTPENILGKVDSNDFSGYMTQVERLKEIHNTFFEYIPDLQAAQTTKEATKKEDKGWDLKKMIITIVLTTLFMFGANATVKSCVTDTNSQPTQPAPSTQLDTLKR